MIRTVVTKALGVLAAASLISVLVGAQSVLASPSICDTTPGNLVANCGFEGGVYSSTIGGSTNTSVPNGWTPNAGYDLRPDFNKVITGPVNSGAFALSIGNFDFEPAPALSQTIVDVPGALYSGSLFVDYGGFGAGDAGAFFDVQINGATVLALNDTAPGAALGFFAYTYSFTGTGSDVLTLTGNTNPSEWFVDDNVILGAPPTGVPEPSSMTLFTLGLIALGGVVGLRRRQDFSFYA